MENMNCNQSARMQCQPLMPMRPSHQNQFGSSNIRNPGLQQRMPQNFPNYPQQQYHQNQNGFGWQPDNSSANIQGQNDTIVGNLPITKRGRGRPKKVVQQQNLMGNNAGIVQKNAIKKKKKQSKVKKNGNKKTNNVNEATDDEENFVVKEVEMIQIEQKEPELTPAEKRALAMDERDKKAVTEKYIECVEKACNGLDLIKADDLFSALCEQTGIYHPKPKTNEEKYKNMRERIESLFQSIYEEGDHMNLAAAMFADRNGELFDRSNPNLHIYVVPKKLDNPLHDRNLQNVKTFRVYGVNFKFLEFAFAIKKMIPVGSGEWSRLEPIAGCDEIDNKPFARSVCINVHHYRLKPFTLLEHWINTKFCRSMKMIENGEEEQQMDQFNAHFHESVKSIRNFKAKWEDGKQNDFVQQQQYFGQQQHFGNPNANCFAFLPSNSNFGSISSSSEYSFCNNSSTSSSPSLLDGQQLFGNNSSFGTINGGHNSSTSSSPSLLGGQHLFQGNSSFYGTPISPNPSLLADQQIIGNYSPMYGPSASPSLLDDQQIIGTNSPFYAPPNANAAGEDEKAIVELAEQLKEYEKRKTNKF